MKLAVDWSYGAEHMHAEHHVTVEEANEALTDPDALLFEPGSREHIRQQRTSDRLLANRHRSARGDPRPPRGRADGVVGRERLAS